MMENITVHPQPPDTKPPASLQTHWMRLADAVRPIIKVFSAQKHSDCEPGHEHQ